MSIAYFNADGKTLCIPTLPGMMPPPDAVYSASVETDDPNAIWFDVVAEQVVARGAFPVVATRNLISGVPTGTTAIFMNGDVETVDDGTIEFDANTEHTEYVRLTHLQYLSTDVEVEVGP